MSGPIKLIMTGAAGSIGTVLSHAWTDRYDLTLVDVRPCDKTPGRVVVADIRDYRAIRARCENQNVLVHLAYVPDSRLGKESGMTNESDIAATIKLFEAAREGGVKRVVFASTNHTTGQNELSTPKLHSSVDQIRPDSWYGAMKVMAEVAGRYFVDAFDMRFIGIRIGTFNGTDIANDHRQCHTLLSPRDCVQLFTRAVEYEGPEKFILTYGTSDNTDGISPGYLDISSARRILGYAPEDNIWKMNIHRFTR